MENLKRDGKKYIVMMGLTVIIQGLLFFLSAWDIFLCRAWLFFGLEILNFAAAILLLSLKNPEVLNARGAKHRNQKAWDKVLVKLYMLFAARLPVILAGLDLGRFQLSDMPWFWVIPGIALYIFSNIISVSSLMVNRHFEPYVRIQTEREHSVVDKGPYQYIRHPGYLAGILWPLAVPLILGSWLALAPAFLSIIILIARTKKEDETLREELPGYQSYSQKVRYRLFPGIW